MRSLNLLFIAGSGLDESEGEHPPGGPLIRALSTGLAHAGWTVEEPDNWRDSGWSIACHRPGSEVLVVLAQAGEERGRWLVQISPTYLPGELVRRLGRRPSASPGACHEAARIVHGVLQGTYLPRVMHWRWDGFPDPDSSSPIPPPPGERRPVKPDGG